MNHLALVLLLPAAWLTWRWSRLVSGALWFTLATWLAYRGIRWAYPDTWAAGHLEWMRGVSMVTGLVGAVEAAQRQRWRRMAFDRIDAWHDAPGATVKPLHAHLGVSLVEYGRWVEGRDKRPDLLDAMLVASMGVDLTAWLIHRGAGQWGPQPFFQVGVLLAMCAISVWPEGK